MTMSTKAPSHTIVKALTGYIAHEKQVTGLLKKIQQRAQFAYNKCPFAL